MPSDSRISDFNAEADKVVRFLQSEYGTLQTGRASASLVEHVEVESYGQRMQVRALAGINVPDAKTIVIQPWDRSTLQAIEKAIQSADIGVNPVNDGTLLRIVLPPMTEERREQMKKLVHKMAEEARISIRQARQKAHDAIKQDPNETLRESLGHQLQKEVDAANKRIEEIRDHKEQEIMTV